MREFNRNLIVVIAILALLTSAWYVHDQQRPVLARVELTETEKLMLTLTDHAEMQKYVITKQLPVGTVIKVWEEAYEHGQRVADIVSSSVRLSEPKRGIFFLYSKNKGDVGVAFSVRGSEPSRGKYPLEKWRKTSSGGGGSGWHGDPFSADGMLLSTEYHGLTDYWQRPESFTALAMDESLRQRFVAENEYVYLLKLQIVKPGTR